MPVNINCTQFQNNKCLHPCAPRSLFFPPECILVNQKDVRIKSCSVQSEYTAPSLDALKPPPKKP